MPLTALNFKPGVIKDDTPLSSEGGWTDADKVRFVRGKPQTIGGWSTATTSVFTGIARGGHAWADNDGRRWLAWGTAAKLYALAGGSLRDITPVHSFGVLTNPFTTASGSNVVSVAHADHALVTGQTVTFSNQSAAVGGLTLSGAYTVTVSDANTYTVTAGANATATATGGGNVDYTAAFVAGLVDGLGEPGGYGSGSYGEGAYGGNVASAATLPRTWALDNWGENLVAVPRGGGLYEYQPEMELAPGGGLPELVTNGDFATAAGWTLGAGWSIGAGVATAAAATASDLSRPVALTPGRMYRVTFTVTRTAGTLTFKTNGSALGYGASSAISVGGTYSRLFRATVGSTSIVFSKDAAFAGTIDNVSVKLADVAYRVTEAPAQNDFMFVDPHRIVVLIGTSLQGDTYNPMAVRWCDRENLTNWTASASNFAGDYLLAVGGKAVSGLATRQQNVIWTDTALYTMAFVDDPSTVFVFNFISAGCGIAGPLAADEQNGVVYWASLDNFFVFGGAAPQPIPCTLLRDFFDNIADGQADKIYCGVNAAFAEVWWLYPDVRDGTECSRYVAFNFQENHWTCGTFNRSTFVASGVFAYPIMLGTDTAWGSNGYVYYHERGQSAAGAPLSGFVEGAYVDLDDGENLMMVRRIVPDFEDQVGPVTINLGLRSWPNAAATTKGPFTAAPNTEKIDLRATARQIKPTFSFSSTPAFMRLGSLRADVLKSGATR